MFGSSFSSPFQSPFAQQTEGQATGTIGQLVGSGWGWMFNRANHGRRPQMGQPTPPDPTNPSPTTPTQPTAPDAPTQPVDQRMGNPFMPISNQPITFGSMLARQPTY